jgi:DNA-directed RNA polymerase alpha subunit
MLKNKKNIKDLCIAELEYLGVSLRVINSLEESKYKIIYLKDLLLLSEKELKTIPNLGSSGLKQISSALEKLDKLESEKKKWHDHT